MQSGNEIWPVYAILLNDFFIKKLYEKCGLETSSSKKDSVKVSMLFGQILIDLLLHI